MNAAPPEAIEEFRACVAARLGLSFDSSKTAFLSEVLQQRFQDGRHAGLSAYLHFLSTSDAAPEWRRLAECLTVTETYFFRNADHFRAFGETVLPARIEARASSRRLRLLSAGCASGEEPRSMAMLMAERFPELAGWDVRVTGVDINPAMLARARSARYSSWSLRETSEDAKQRYFRLDGREFLVEDAFPAALSFEERNLVEANPDLWQPGAYDVIFCRNMLMYLMPEEARRLVSRIAGALAPDGFLFLGHAETLRGLSQDFHLCQTHGTFYYQRKTGPATVLTTVMSGDQAVFNDLRSAEPFPWDPSASWMDVIQKASEKIAGLAARNAQRQKPGAPAPRGAPAWSLSSAMDLLRQERFHDALHLLRQRPPESKDDPDAQLLHAVLLTNAGDLKGAQEICRKLLAQDELNAAAHYVTALCCEHAGDAAAAEAHDRAAIYLDAGFAMPWLHLGLLARRSGRRAQARECLEQALALLAKEDASRILLLGGGFGRETLIRLCRGEMTALGAAA